MKNKGFIILIVDDSPLIVERVVAMFRDLLCFDSCYTAWSYEQAVETISKNEIDVALLDINLPSKNGIELLNYIKVNHPLTQCIMLTNQSDFYYRNLCSKMGAAYFLDKTSEFQKIPELVTACYEAVQ